jgi:hypothetical protein
MPTDKKQWDEKDVENMLTNPIYTGIGPYQQIVPEDVFVKAGEQFIKRYGAERYIRSLLAALRGSFPADSTTVDGAVGPEHPSAGGGPPAGHA